MRDGVRRKCCPKCGGVIVVSFHWQFTHDYKITKRGRLSKRFTRSSDGPMEIATAACKSCDAYWDADGFYIDADDTFWDCKYVEDEE